MLDARTIKAARALLDWTQEELARKSGLSLPALANIERGATSPRRDTLLLLQQTFEQNGIEFLEPAGVQLSGEKFSLKIHKGQDVIFQLWADLSREFSDGRGGELLLSSVQDRPVVERYPKEMRLYLKRMDELNVTRRILICEGDEEIVGNQPHFYRQMPKILFAQTAHYIYKDKVALMLWDLPRIILIESRSMAGAFRTQFEYNWSVSRPLERYVSIL